LSAEFIYQIFSLLIAIIIVHAFYVAVIRSNADSFIKAEMERIKTDKNYVARQSVYVVVKDLEQEVCFILFFWAVAILGYKGVVAVREQNLLYTDLVPVREGGGITPADIVPINRTIQNLPEVQQDYLLPRALTAALHRFQSGGSVQDVAMAIRSICDSESDRQESELSMIRYIVWAIPSIGFIGTVRGIGQALGQAYKAVEGDITGVTQNLGVAFNSTLVALLISIVLMLIVHQLQSVQERNVLDTEDYCDQHLIRHLEVNKNIG
jgi:biopolymer transport protein ExbB/TolQ